MSTVQLIVHNAFNGASNIMQQIMYKNGFTVFCKYDIILLANTAKENDMANKYIIENGILKSCTCYDKNVIIPAGVIHIGSSAFEECDITQVSFEDNSLRSIDNRAFYNCKSLESLLIPDGVVQIGDLAFFGCNNMKYIGIPSTTILIGENALLGTASDLVIIGKKNSEAEKYAKKMRLVFDTDRDKVISGINVAMAARASAETRTFDVFGELISCSNTLSLYHSVLEYYANKKEKFFVDIVKQIPEADIKNRHKSNPRLPIELAEKDAVSRLEAMGVYVTIDSMSSALVSSYANLVEALKTIFDSRNEIYINAANDVTANRQALLDEAERKVTGLSYGIVGDSLDMIAYAYDDYKERQRQRREAYERAKEQDQEYMEKTLSQADKAYSTFLDKVLPSLHNITDSVMNAFRDAEIEKLVEAGLIEKNVLTDIDISKSEKLSDAFIRQGSTDTFVIAMALKNYPCNVAALVYAAEAGLTCDGLNSMIDFLNLGKRISDSIDEIWQERIKKLTINIKELVGAPSNFIYKQTINNCIEMITPYMSNITEIEIANLLRELQEPITQSINKAIDNAIDKVEIGVKKLDTFEDRIALTHEAVDIVISEEQWAFFVKHGVEPYLNHGRYLGREELIEELAYGVDSIRIANLQHKINLLKVHIHHKRVFDASWYWDGFSIFVLVIGILLLVLTTLLIILGVEANFMKVLGVLLGIGAIILAMRFANISIIDDISRIPINIWSKKEARKQLAEKEALLARLKEQQEKNGSK